LLLVIVNIHEYKPSGKYQGPEQIWLMPNTDSFTIRRWHTPSNGKLEHFVNLSEVLPQTIQQNSPMKGVLSGYPFFPLSYLYSRWSNL
jgi:hypothetical protein